MNTSVFGLPPCKQVSWRKEFEDPEKFKIYCGIKP